MTKQLSIFNAQKSTSSQILCCVLERFIHIRNPTKLGRKGLDGSSLTKATETLTESMESRLNSSGTSFPGFTTLQLCGKVTDLLSRLGETPETFTGRILFMSMFNDISFDGKGNEEECVANARVVKVHAKPFGIGQWSFFGPGSEKSASPVTENHNKNGYVNHKNLIMTNEDNNRDTKYTNKNDTNNHNAHDLHK